MPHIIATERALYWAVGEPVVAAGLIEVSGALLTGLSLRSSANENEFLGLVAGKASDYAPLPAVGEWLEAGNIYGYKGGLIIVRQSHNRMHYAPEDTPALFSVYRENVTDALEWVANERVEVGMRRTYGGLVYQCLQAHTAESTGTPVQTLGVLWAVYIEPGPDIPEWVSGEALTYDPVNPAKRTYQGRIYELRQNPGINIWPPPTVPALWLDIGPLWNNRPHHS